MAERDVQWFVESLNSYTNTIVVRFMELDGDIYDFGTESTKDKRKIYVFRCSSYNPVGGLLRCRKEQFLKLRIYVRRGGHGPLNEWTLYGRSKVKNTWK